MNCVLEPCLPSDIGQTKSHSLDEIPGAALPRHHSVCLSLFYFLFPGLSRPWVNFTLSRWCVFSPLVIVCLVPDCYHLCPTACSPVCLNHAWPSVGPYVILALACNADCCALRFPQARYCLQASFFFKPWFVP